jgi:hypothetical protein
MKETKSMMSYKAWRTINQKLMNESALGATTLGLKTPASLGITGSKLSEMGFPPPEGEEEDDLLGGEDADLDPDADGDVDVPGAGPELDPDQDADELAGMDDPDMLALLGGDEEGGDEMAPEGDDLDPTALGDDGGMLGDEEDEFAFNPADLGGAGPVHDQGKSADLSNLLGGMGVSPEDEVPDMGMGDEEEGADISSLFGGADAGEDDGVDSANPFGGEEEGEDAPEGEADDENIEDELDSDMDDEDADEEGSEEEETKFMGKGWCGKMMKKEGKEFPAFLKKGKDKKNDKKNEKKGDKKANPFAKKEDKKGDKPFELFKKGKGKKDDKKDDKKGGKPFELFKKGKKKEEKVDETSFFNSLAKQAAGDVRKLKEDALVANPKQAKKEPGPGDVGYAPSGRVGQLPSVGAYNEWKAKNFPKKK